jgi:hypothetical protein
MNIYRRPKFERESLRQRGSKTAKFERDELEETTKPKAVHSIRCTILNILNYITKYGLFDNCMIL